MMTAFTKFEVDTDMHCLVIALLLLKRYVTWPCDLDRSPFDLGQWSYMAGHVITNFEYPTAIHCW